MMRVRLEQPPVKAACLACRASKTRCNGQNPCDNCVIRDRECIFRPSRRGAKPRLARADATSISTSAERTSGSIIAHADNAYEFLRNDTNLEPGIYGSPASIALSGGRFEDNASSPAAPANEVRLYQNEVEVLQAYYIFIHPCFPLLPPAVKPTRHHDMNSTADEGRITSNLQSPLAYALAALLIMIPKRRLGKQAPVILDSCALALADAFLRSALQKIDDEMDMTDPPQRLTLHPDVPLYLESILALFLIALFEYCHRGNLNKARRHLASALSAAMDANIHDAGVNTSEALQRTWWMMTYFSNQLTVMHALPALVEASDPRLKTPLPHFEDEAGTWKSLLAAQHVFLASAAPTKTAKGSETFEMLEARLIACIQEVDRPRAHALARDSETNAIHNWRAVSRITVHSARIKLYRAAAFAEVPVFVDRHCDMAVISIDPSRPNAPISPNSIAATVSGHWSAYEQGNPEKERALSESCFSSALAVIRLFRELTSIQLAEQGYSIHDEHDAFKSSWPLMVPLLACSAMQACYVLIATLCRLRSSVDMLQSSILETERAIEEIRHGLETTLDIYRVYVTRFAWLKPMHDELESVYKVTFPNES